MVTGKNPQRIAIVDADIADTKWAAGSSYIRMLAYSLGDACRSAGVELYLLSNQHGVIQDNGHLQIKRVPISSPAYFRGEWRLRNLLRLPPKSSVLHTAREHQVSVLLPLFHIPDERSDISTIGWIPDFQHVYLPEFFSEGECRVRDKSFRQLANRATRILVSSRNAFDHFVAFVPDQAHKARVCSFPSLFAFESFERDARSSQRKFNIPEKFALVANQFWRHKNHMVVVEAIRLLRQKGLQIPVVMIGLPADYRDPANQTVSQLLQAIASFGLGNQISTLGLVPHKDLVNLMRTAAIMIQPSHFEGWSTVVQDAKALGRPLICSDIPVHREQAPEGAGFFPCDRADVLADLLAAIWETLEPGPNESREAQALAREREFARSHGQSLLAICQEANSC